MVMVMAMMMIMIDDDTDGNNDDEWRRRRRWKSNGALKHAFISLVLVIKREDFEQAPLFKQYC